MPGGGTRSGRSAGGRPRPRRSRACRSPRPERFAATVHARRASRHGQLASEHGVWRYLEWGGAACQAAPPRRRVSGGLLPPAAGCGRARRGVESGSRVNRGRSRSAGRRRSTPMNRQQAARAEVALVDPGTASGTLAGARRRWLRLARAGWAAVAALQLGLAVAVLPRYFASLRTVCIAPPCPAWQLTAGQARSLTGWGLSPDGYAAYIVALQVLSTLGFWAVALLLFRRRSDEWLALFIS